MWDLNFGTWISHRGLHSGLRPWAPLVDNNVTQTTHFFSLQNLIFTSIDLRSRYTLASLSLSLSGVASCGRFECVVS